MANMWIYHPYTGELMNGPGRHPNNQHSGDQQHFPEHGRFFGIYGTFYANTKFGNNFGEFVRHRKRVTYIETGVCRQH